MSGNVTYIEYIISDLWELADLRLNQFRTIKGGPWFILFLTAIYLLIAIKIGPKLMENRKPVGLRYLLITYNVLMIAINVIIHMRTSLITKFGYYTWGCAPFGPYSKNNDPIVMECFSLGWYFYMSKYVDWLDTIFFILRKKSQHLSTLHIWHHALMPLFTWLGLKYIANMNIGFIVFINTFIHSIMYFYYLLTTLQSGHTAKSAPKVGIYRFLHWKKWLTTLQIVQLVLIVTHSVHYVFLNCEAIIIGRAFILLTIIVTGSFIYLFLMFFKQQYACMNRGQARAKVN